MASLGSLVIELAANTARLQGDLGRGVNMLQNFASKAKSVVGGLGAGIGGGLLANLAKQAIELGDELQKGAQRAGVSASTFSQLAAAAKQADIDIGTLSKGLKNMQVAISTAAQGGKEAQSAFRQLGINLDTLRTATPDEQLKRVADALKAVPDPAERARLGTTALGKAYLDLVPLLDQGRAGITALVEEQKRLGNTFSDEQIKKLAETDEAIKRLKSSFSGLATTLTAAVAPALTGFFDSLTGAPAAKVAALNDEITRLKAQIEREGETGATPFLRQRLTDLEQQRGRERLRAPAVTHSRGLNFSADIAEQRRQDEANREEREKDAKELAKLSNDIKKNFVSDRVETNQQIKQSTDDLIEQQSQLLGGSQQVFTQFMEEQQRGWDNLTAYQRGKTDEMSEFARQAARNMQSAFADFLFDPFSHGVKGLLKDFINVIRRMVAEAAAAKIFESLFGKVGKDGSGGAGGFLGDLLGGIFGAGGKGIAEGENNWLGKIIKGAGAIFGGIFGGGRAMGGPVSAGTSYLVGENGPERFIPRASGYIVPNGGMTFAPVYNIDARGATTDLIAQLPSVLRANNDALKADILDTLSRRPPPSRR